MFIFTKNIFFIYSTCSVQLYIRAFIHIVNFFIYVTMARFLSEKIAYRLVFTYTAFLLGVEKFLEILSVPLMFLVSQNLFLTSFS